MSSQAMCASPLNGAGSSQLRTSVSKAAGWGQENAQLLGVLAGITAGLFWLGTYVSEYKVMKQKLSNVEELMKQKLSNVEELMKQKSSNVEELMKVKVSNIEKLIAKDRELTTKDREVVEEKVKAAKAAGAKETADRFLVFGYAAEYDKFREKVKGGAAANNADGDGQRS